MKNSDFEIQGLKAMNPQELMETEGGIHWLLAAALGGLIYDIISCPSDCVNGFKDGYNS